MSAPQEAGVEGALATGAVLFALGLVAVPFAGELLRRLPRRVPVFFARWGFSHVLLVGLSSVAAGFVFGPAIHALFAKPVAEGEPEVGVVGALWLTMAMLGTGVLGALTLARRLQPEGLAALGICRRGNPRGMLAGGLAYVLVLPGVVGVSVLWPVIAGALGFTVEPQEVLVGIEQLSGIGLWQAVVLAVFAGPFLEETLFRGFLQPLLVQNLSERGGVAATSALFAAMHGVSAFGPLFALSLLLGYVQLRTHRLAAAWFVHGLHNAVTLAIVLLLPDWYASLNP